MRNLYAMLFLASSALLVSGCVGGFAGAHRDFPPGEDQWNGSFQPSEDDIAEVTGVFDSAGGLENISGYCGTNRFLCGYYCRTINPDHGFCSQLDFRVDRGFLNESRV